jgi:hypothetical protein
MHFNELCHKSARRGQFMQPSKARPNSTGIDENAAKHVADLYVAETFGPDYQVQSVERIPGYWWVRLACQHPALGQTVVGSVKVDVQTGKVVLLTASEVEDIQERADVMAAQRRGDLARGPEGYILPYHAKIKANRYLGDYVAFFASVEGRPVWVDGEPPMWCVATALYLRGHGKVCELGPMYVNALTGEVVPLSNDEISTRQKRARHAAKAVEHSTAARG